MVFAGAAPDFNSSCTMILLPCFAAQCNAVQPCELVALTEAPCDECQHIDAYEHMKQRPNSWHLTDAPLR